MPIERIPFVGAHNQRTIDARAAMEAGQDQQFMNVTFDVVRNPVTGRSVVYCEKRPGWGVLHVVAAGSVSTGLIRADSFGTVVSAWGDTNSAIYDSQTSVGSITGKALHFSETILSGTSYILIRSSDGTAWYYSPGGAPTLISDGDFVTTGTTISAFTELDGYVFYAAADGFLYNSDLNSITAYTATNKIAVNMQPDTPLAVFKHRNLIGVSGTASTEFFYNAGNASGSPLSRAEQHFKLIGIQNQRSLTRLGDDIYFASSSREGDVKIMRLRDMSIQPVSTPHIDRLLGTSSAFGSDMHLSGFQLGGYSYVAVVVLSSAATEPSYLLMESDDNLLLENGDDIILDADTTAATGLSHICIYNVDLNIWCEWDTTVMTYIRGAGAGSLNQIIATSRLSTSGKIYLMNPSGDGAIFADDGTNYDMQVRTSQLDHGTGRRKFINSVRLACDKFEGTALLEANDHDYDSTKWVTLGSFDGTQNEPILYRCGSYTGHRAYRLTYSEPSAFRVSALEIDYTIGSH